jgi:hypothetical protein
VAGSPPYRETLARFLSMSIQRMKVISRSVKDLEDVLASKLGLGGGDGLLAQVVRAHP